MAALTSALAVKPTAGAFQTALDRRTCGGETSRGVLCVARASARARGALAGVSRPGRVVFSEERSRSAWGLGIRASARPRDVVSSDVDAWRGEAQRCSAAAAASEGDASGESASAPRATVTPVVNKGKLQTRVVSALCLGAFGLFVTCTGGWVWAVWMAGASYLSAKEYFTMVPNMTSELPHPPPKWACDVSVLVCTLFCLVLQACGARTGALVMSTLGAFGVVAFLLTTKQDEPHFSQYTAALFGIVYCGALPAFWVKLRALAFSKSASLSFATGASGSRFVEAWPSFLGGPEAWTTGLIVTVITVSCVIASDVGAYAFGKTFGKTQLIKISPNKTVEGALGGLLCTMLTAFGLRQLFGWHAGAIQTIMLGALVFFAAVAGDLMESVMKRNAGMKDSGDIIPGHGGFLDRFDSYMFTGVSVYFYIVTVMPYWFVGMVL